MYGCDWNQEDEEFDPKEFYNLDFTLDMIIYSRIAYFREHFANEGTPCNFNSHEEWLDILDRILIGFKLSLTNDFPNPEEQKIINNARVLLTKIWSDLWV